MSNILRHLQTRPERLQWKTSWHLLKERLIVKSKDCEKGSDPDESSIREAEIRCLIVGEILIEMKLIENGTSLP